MNPNIFLHTVLREAFACMHNVEQDNYDARRFSHDGIDRSQDFDPDRHADYMALFAAQHAGFFATWLLLRDDVSRHRYIQLIKYRLLGHRHVRIDAAAGASGEERLYATAAGWRTGVSPLPASGMFGPLQHFENVVFDDWRLRLDCWPANVVYSFLKRQYFLERPGLRIQPEPGDTVIDAGACLGDTAVAFAARVGGAGRVFAFDPLPAHVMASRHNIAQNGLGGCASVIPLALGNATRDAGLALAPDGGAVVPGFSIVGQEERMPLTTLDDFVAAEKPGRIDFIKMDIEGAELAALQGASATLTRDRPKLAISLYHRPDDFIALPQFLATLLSDYDFHLDHYTIHAEETVLYACPRRR